MAVGNEGCALAGRAGGFSGQGPLGSQTRIMRVVPCSGKLRKGGYGSKIHRATDTTRNPPARGRLLIVEFIQRSRSRSGRMTVIRGKKHRVADETCCSRSSGGAASVSTRRRRHMQQVSKAGTCVEPAILSALSQQIQSAVAEEERQAGEKGQARARAAGLPRVRAEKAGGDA